MRWIPITLSCSMVLLALMSPIVGDNDGSDFLGSLIGGEGIIGGGGTTTPDIGGLIGGGSTVPPIYDYCTSNGGHVSGGNCIFSDGSSCELWAFYRGECSPTPAPTPMPGPVGPVIGPGTENPAAARCVQQGYESRNGRCYFPDGTSCDEWAFYYGSCSYNPQPSPIGGMPNPASQNCADKGYQSKIVTNPDGSQTGYCVFPDGSSCEEWAFYRGTCSYNPEPVGQPGVRTFTFQAVGAGETDIVFKLVGPDGTVKDVRTKHVVVHS